VVAGETQDGRDEQTPGEHGVDEDDDGEGENSGLSPALPDPAEPSGRMSVVQAACRDR
jgi:hypothetical protein